MYRMCPMSGKRGHGKRGVNQEAASTSFCRVAEDLSDLTAKYKNNTGKTSCRVMEGSNVTGFRAQAMNW